VAAALDDPAVVACGAIVSTDGGDGFWLHGLDGLLAGRSRHGGSITFADLRSTGRALRPSTIEGERTAGFELKMPDAGELQTVRDAFRTAIGVEPTALASADMRTAWVFARQVGSFVIVGNGYVCDKGRELYNQKQYDAYAGKCPKHKGGKLVSAP
jgi:hypothetical protein